MSRTLRPHLPGNAFHITARTQGRSKWFTKNLRDDVVQIIHDAVACSTTELIAYTVMPNHLHLIVRQGPQPLGWFMQRVLQRTAWLVRRAIRPNGQGHVFGGRYWSGVLNDASYLRQAIIYTHLNAQYAYLCSRPEDYRWSSHNSYAGTADAQGTLSSMLVEHGLSVFASDAPGVDARQNYLAFIDYWMSRKRLPLASKFSMSGDDVPDAPRAAAGDANWFSEYAAAVSTGIGRVVRTDDDVQDLAIAALRTIDSKVTLYDLRSCGRIKKLCAIRRAVIARLLSEDCRNGAIARCLNVSPSHVSIVAAELRKGMTPP